MVQKGMEEEFGRACLLSLSLSTQVSRDLVRARWIDHIDLGCLRLRHSRPTSTTSPSDRQAGR